MIIILIQSKWKSSEHFFLFTCQSKRNAGPASIIHPPLAKPNYVKLVGKDYNVSGDR